MNLKTTIVLLVLAGCCFLLYWKGPGAAPSLGLAPKAQPASDQGTVKTIADLPVDQITQIKIAVPGQPELILEAKAPGQPLELPGKWPIRRYEVKELLEALRGLKSRFQPYPINNTTDLAQFGLSDDMKPVAVEITTPAETIKLKFGEPPLKAGQNPFTRDTFVQMEGKNEVLRLGPQVMPVLLRTEETYRRRQLFPEWYRAAVTQPKRPSLPMMEEPESGSAPVFLVGDAVKTLSVATPSGRFTLERVAPMPQAEPPADKPDGDPTIQPSRLADSWMIVEPVHDRIDPDKAKAILTAVPNLWVEKFIPTTPHTESLFGLGDHPEVTPKLLTFLGAIAPGLPDEAPLRAILNLACLSEAKSPSASLSVKLNDGTERTLQIGRVSRTIGPNELRFAKLDKNPLIFELKGDRLNDLQINFTPPSKSTSSPVDDLRDPVLVRFDDNQVSGIAIVYKYGKDSREIKLEKTGDEWKIVEPKLIAGEADRIEVTELLNLLKGMEARKGSMLDGTLGLPQLVLGGFGSIDPRRLLGLAPEPVRKITLTFDAKSGLKPATFLVGFRDAAANKRSVMVEGRGRINIVDDRGDARQVSKLDRQPSGYRTVKLFDPIAAKLGEIIVQRGATEKHPADSYTIQKPDDTSNWSISAPFKAVADAQSAKLLAADLTGLAKQKYFYDPETDAPPTTSTESQPVMTDPGKDAPKKGEFTGLDKPALTVTLKFLEPKGASDVVLEIGKQQSDKEYFARVKGTTGVFLIPDKVVKNLDQNPEALVDKALVQLAANSRIQKILRSVNGQELEIAQNSGALWEVTKPAKLVADQTVVGELAQQLSLLRASRIESVVPKSLKEYGLEPPVATVTVEASENGKSVSRVLLIGNPVDAKNPKGERFVQAQGSPVVAVIPGGLAQQLLAEPLKFRDLALGGFISADKFTIERGDRKVTFVKDAGIWKMTEPLATAADDEDLREVYELLAKLRAEELVEDNPKDLAKYGLDKPVHWRVFNGDRELLHLLVGDKEKIGPDKKTEGFRAYAMLDKGNTVVLLDPLLTGRLFAEYRKRALWDPVQPAQIKEVSIKSPSPGGSFTLAKGPMGWIDPEKPAERLNPELVNDLLNTLGSLKAYRYVVDKNADLTKYGLDKPRTVTFVADDGKKHSILVGNLFEGKRLYAKLDDPSRTDVFLLNELESASIDRPRASYTQMMKKEEPKKTDPKTELKKSDDSKKETGPTDKK